MTPLTHDPNQKESTDAAATTTRVSAIFKRLDNAGRCLSRLTDSGIASEAIDVMWGGAQVDSQRFVSADETQAGTAALAGGAIGGAFAAAAATALALPGVGVLAAGPIAALVAGGGIGALSGGALGALVGLGIPRHEASVRLAEIEAGDTVLLSTTVDQPEALASVLKIMESCEPLEVIEARKVAES